jgi:hypothetical protein
VIHLLTELKGRKEAILNMQTIVVVSRQATSATQGASIDLQAPDIITKLQTRYTKTLRPLLTKDDQQLTDVFLNNTLVAIGTNSLSSHADPCLLLNAPC